MISFFIIIIYNLILKTQSLMTYDSFFNIYKDTIYSSNLYEEISNTTWKEYFISEKIKKLVKIVPFYIDNDEDLDLFVQDSAANLYWVSNMRGTSKDFKNEKISKNFLEDFVVSNRIYIKYGKNQFFVLAINQEKNMIYKFKRIEIDISSPNITQSNHWKEEIFIDINDKKIPSISSVSSNSKIKSINLYEINENEQILLLLIENYRDYSDILFKILIKDEKIFTITRMNIGNSITVIGAYDMNNDNLIDILYLDYYNNLYVLLNDDPFYYKIFVNQIKPTFFNNNPRIFTIDSNRDNYPDFVVGDTEKNTIGILFNKGIQYWNRVKEFYNNKENKENNIEYNKEEWSFIPLIDINKDNINNKLTDFTLILINEHKRLNFEIFAIFTDKTYWFIEKEIKNVKIDWKSPQTNIQNYNYCMIKCNILIEKQNQSLNNNYNLILDTDINKDSYPEFILYSSESSSLYFIQRYEPYLVEFGWKANFWIYLMITIYTISTIIGGFEFYNLNKLNDEYMKSKLIINEEDKNKEIEFGVLSDQ